MPYHIAQLNIARAKAEMDSEVMSGFVARLEEINALADAAPGFVWRLQTEAGDATELRVFGDPLLLVNMSVWEDLDRLRDFVYRSVHRELLRGREAWFGKLEAQHLVLWWVPAGHIPTLEEAKERLDTIRRQGPGAEAFTFGRAYPPPE